MNDSTEYKGSCFCGDIEFVLTGAPEVMGHCHCSSCRRWAAGPVSAFTLWKTEAVNVSKGSDNMIAFDGNPGSDHDTVVSIRKTCKTCGGHVLTEHPTMGLTDIPSVLIKDFKFTPAFHAHYQETVFPIKDGLTKFKDLPKEAGGSGETLPE